MPARQLLATALKIEVDGQKIEDRVRSSVSEVIIDQSVHLPHMLVIRLQDPELTLLDEGPFDLTKKVRISAGDDEDDYTVLFEGEITALEPDFGEGMVLELLVRGYDHSHRMLRETKSRAFLNKKDSDLAAELAKEENLDTVIDTTATVYDHIYQHNQTDLALLTERAWRIGYECFVESNTLYFRKPPSGGASLTLRWGSDLLAFRPRMTLASQVSEVFVRGWDPEKQQPIVGQAKEGTLYPDIKEGQNGAQWAEKFGSRKLVIVDQPVVSQAEADTLAAARLDERSGAFILAEGEAYRRPNIKAGAMIELQLLGKRLSGTYLVTGATHIYNADGFRTTFEVRGARTGLLSDQLQGRPFRVRWPGVVPAVVTNNHDPKNWGRVKVKFPWMSEDAESDWARMAGLGGGPEAGLYFVPDVDDEVLVAFEHGDFSRPYVLGGLWNGKHGVPPTAAGAGQNERPLVRTWHSRTGHAITMHDDADNKLELITAGGHRLNLDDSNQKIAITSSGGLTVTLDDSGSKIVVESAQVVEVKAGTDMTLEAGSNLELKAGVGLKLQGTNVDVNGSGQVTVKGGLIKLN